MLSKVKTAEVSWPLLGLCVRRLSRPLSTSLPLSSSFPLLPAVAGAGWAQSDSGAVDEHWQGPAESEGEGRGREGGWVSGEGGGGC